ncbi:MAG: hypothetical protein AAGI52_11500 [Bacteroidota bacterium]
MRFLLLAALVFPVAAIAQTAADSALVQRFSEAARLDAAAEAGLSVMDGIPEAGALFEQLMGDLTPQAFLDSTHAAFYRDLRPDALEAAIEAFESPAFATILDFERTMGTSFSAITQEMESVLANPNAYDLADESLTREYLAATQQTERMVSMMEVLMVRMMSAFPGAAEEAAGEGLTVEEMVGQMIESDLRPMMDSTMHIATRYALREASDDDIRYATAFYASEAGQYVNDTLWAGSLAAIEPFYRRLMDMMGGLFQSLDEVEADETCKKGSPGCQTPPADGE